MHPPLLPSLPAPLLIPLLSHLQAPLNGQLLQAQVLPPQFHLLLSRWPRACAEAGGWTWVQVLPGAGASISISGGAGLGRKEAWLGVWARVSQTSRMGQLWTDSSASHAADLCCGGCDRGV